MIKYTLKTNPNNWNLLNKEKTTTQMQKLNLSQTL